MGEDKFIMRAHPYTPKKLSFPVYVSEKKDGVPVDIAWRDTGIYGISRQGEPMNAPIAHFIEALKRCRVRGSAGFHIVGELYIPGVPFKTISGLARRKEPDQYTSQLELHLFDAYYEQNAEMDFDSRLLAMQAIVERAKHPMLKITGQNRVLTQPHLDEFILKFKAKNMLTTEGLCFKNHDGLYYPTIRSWDFQKLKWKETRDLEVVSFEEAINKHGTPKGMVGRINVRYRKTGDIVGVGPGCMKHNERAHVWHQRGAYIGQIAEVEFMPDKSYVAGMREAKFIRWRDDKNEGE